MARMRTIKPEACTSETLAQVPREVRWTFGTFWTHCDDEGRAAWNLRLIKAAIYPLDDDVTIAVLDREFGQLEAVGAVCRYEIDGREYVHIPSWPDHQHPNRKVESKLPTCPKTDHSPPAHAQRTEPAVSAHEPLTPVVVGEGRVDGSGEVEGAALERARTAAATRPPTPETVNQRSQRLSKIYADLVPLSRFPATLGIVKKACDAGKSDNEIASALQRIAAEGRSLTVETLRIEIEGCPPPHRNGRRTTDDKVRDGLELAQRLASQEQPHRQQLGA